MKIRKALIPILIISTIVLFDQLLKIYVKTHFRYGEDCQVIGDWFQLEFIENDGMAYGWRLNLPWGKLVLTSFRLAAVIWGTWYITKLLRQGQKWPIIVCASLIYAGTLGNLIDSCFYGIVFNKGVIFSDPHVHHTRYGGIAAFSRKGYSYLFHGNVVDMLYFPIFSGRYPSWVPRWGGQYFEIFNFVFNVADASIAIGVALMIIIFLRKRRHPASHLPIV